MAADPRGYLKGKRNMVWTFMGNTRMYQALSDYGDRLDTVGIFSFNINLDGTINETGVSVGSLAPYRSKWPHIKWLLTCMNNGTAEIFTALRNNTNGARDMFLSELVRIMGKYPWCAGVDIDLEKGGDFTNRAAATSLFQQIYQTVKTYNPTKLVNICLPGMTSIEGSVGGENWCVYSDLNSYCDTAAIMSYGMAWAGSAPGPVSPRDWLEGIYDYAVTVIEPGKLFMGLPGYGWEWQIYTTPHDDGKTYRGTSLTYYAAKIWGEGGYHWGQEPYIPWLAYWDDYDAVPFMFPHVYDFAEGGDATTVTQPMTGDVYNRRHYLTCYGKTQHCEFGTVIVDRDGTPDTSTGNHGATDGVLTLGTTGTATYNFTVSTSGTYDVAVKICYPFWDKNSITVALDGQPVTFSESRLWWPYWRKTCWQTLTKNHALAAGNHTVTVTGGVAGAQFYGFRICTDFTEAPSAGSALFDLSPHSFKATDGTMAQPNHGFRLTTEVLRRKPDSALIWYEDFRDYTTLQSTYWQTLNGSWSVWRSDQYSMDRVYSQLEGSGQLAWKYNQFNDVHLRARIAFPANGRCRAGVFLGDIFCCINIDNQRVELYQGSTLLGSWQGSYAKTPNNLVRSNPNMYLLEMRKRGNQVRVYSGTSNVLRFTASVSPTTGNAGIQSDGPIKCELLRAGEAWVYEPYEAFDVTMPDGTVAQYGRGYLG